MNLPSKYQSCKMAEQSWSCWDRRWLGWLSYRSLLFLLLLVQLSQQEDKEVSEKNEGDGVAKTISPKEESHALPSISRHSLKASQGYVTISGQWPGRRSDTCHFSGEAIESQYAFSISLLLPTATLTVGNHVFLMAQQQDGEKLPELHWALCEKKINIYFIIFFEISKFVGSSFSG